MKKIIWLIVTIIIASFVIILVFKTRKEISKTPKKVLEINYNKYNFYKEEKLEEYKNYKLKYPTLLTKDIILRVNMGLNHSFYTETKEVKEFNLLMLVNKYNYVTSEFVPDNLVLVEEYAKNEMYLNKECHDAFINMASHASEEGYNIRAISTYRTIEYQENLYNNYVKSDGVIKADTYSARPGYSEHHTGLAIDVDNKVTSYNDFESTKEFTWMMENAYKYGFILRYPKDSTITGYIYEPWHFRYVGGDVANYIHEHNITFEEYYYEFLDN